MGGTVGTKSVEGVCAVVPNAAFVGKAVRIHEEGENGPILGLGVAASIAVGDLDVSFGIENGVVKAILSETHFIKGCVIGGACL